jgi:mannose-6-phosphate isomerase-like protein (cupin superfamily)
MFTASIDEAPRRERDGLVSHVLLETGTVPDTALAVTWVEVEPGAGQVPHRHPPEQVYVLVAGRGRMRIGDEERELRAGDLARVPPSVEHGILNTGQEPLVYVSAASPAFSVTGAYDSGAIRA